MSQQLSLTHLTGRETEPHHRFDSYMVRPGPTPRHSSSQWPHRSSELGPPIRLLWGFATPSTVHVTPDFCFGIECGYIAQASAFHSPGCSSGWPGISGPLTVIAGVLPCLPGYPTPRFVCRFMTGLGSLYFICLLFSMWCWGWNSGPVTC